MTDPKFSRLKTWLQNTDLQKKNFPLYQLLEGIITLLTKEQGITNVEISDVTNSVSNITNSDLLTHSDETANLPQSRQLIAGTFINFNDLVSNQRTVNVLEPLIKFPIIAGIHSLTSTGSSGSESIDHVLLSDGGNPPSPIHNGAGSFIYVPYTP